MSISSNQFLVLKYCYIKKLLEHFINFYEHLLLPTEYVVSDLFCFPASAFRETVLTQVTFQF